MAKSLKWWTRKLHRWGAVLTAIPLALVIVSGLLLQIKKEVPWVQPPTQRGQSNALNVGWEQILASAKTDTNAKIESWQDIDRLDVRPSKGLIKVRCENGWELQLDSFDGKILSSAFRRSDFIESLHDGSFFTNTVKLCVFLPNGIVLFLLWLSGIYLWLMPVIAKYKKRDKRIKQD